MLDATKQAKIAGEELDIRSDGAVLRGRIIRPWGTLRVVMVLHGATGAPARFYRGFAEWAAAERDLAVLTYDYRDFGASRRRPMRGSKATLNAIRACLFLASWFHRANRALGSTRTGSWPPSLIPRRSREALRATATQRADHSWPTHRAMRRANPARSLSPGCLTLPLPVSHGFRISRRPLWHWGFHCRS